MNKQLYENAKIEVILLADVIVTSRLDAGFNGDDDSNENGEWLNGNG